MKSLKQCIQTLVRCAGGDGNLLFNVGPMPTGEIEPRQVERLKEMGAWLEKYGKTIYGTRGGPFRPGRWGASTYKDDKIYLHILEWEGEKILLPPIQKKIIVSSALTGGNSSVKVGKVALELSVPEASRQEIDTIVVLHLDGPAAEASPAKMASGSVAAGKKATASNVFQKDSSHGPDKALDDDGDTRWATDAGTHQAWIEVDLGEEVTLQRALIREAYDRVEEFQLQRKEGDGWTPFARGTRIGKELTMSFDPVKARWVRLDIVKATEGPTIWEFQLFSPED
jgi:alpha-L-fucosidase